LYLNHTFLISNEKSIIDLSLGAIQQFLYDQGEDEQDWFAEELKHLSPSKEEIPNLTNDQLNELRDKYTQNLSLTSPVLPLLNMMETETWTHPTHANISTRIELWRNSVFKMNRHLYKTSYPSSESVGSSDNEKEKKKDIKEHSTEEKDEMEQSE